MPATHSTAARCGRQPDGRGLQAHSVRRMSPATQIWPNGSMKTIDEMLHLALLTSDQHHQISAWIAQADSPEEILNMPPPLWQALEQASAIMGVDKDLLRQPTFEADDAGA